MAEKYSDEEIAFARAVAALRKENGWTLANMADLLVEHGVEYANTMTVSRTENGQRPVRMTEALAYSRIFRRSIAELVEDLPEHDERIEELESNFRGLHAAWQSTRSTLRGFAMLVVASRGWTREAEELIASGELRDEEVVHIHRVLNQIADVARRDPGATFLGIMTGIEAERGQYSAEA